MVALKKLSVEKGLIKVLQSLYNNSRSRIRVNSTFNVDLLLQVGLHQDAIIYHSTIYEMRSECQKNGFRLMT